MTETADDLIARLNGFTPGPWAFNGAYRTFCGTFTGKDDLPVCHFGDNEEYYPTKGECPDEADAALIAAAPDLHRELAAALAREAALREALSFYANPEVYRPHPHGIAFDRRDISHTARAAIEVKP